MLTHAFGELGLATYLVIEDQREVYLLRIDNPQNVSLPWIRCADQPRWRAAASSASPAARTCPRSETVKKSRSSVGRAVRCWASKAAPPVSRKPWAIRQGEEQPGHLQLESREIRPAVSRRH